MAGETHFHEKLDQLRRRCDLLLDESLSVAAYCRDVVEVVAEVEDLAAAALIEFSGPSEHVLLGGARLDQLSLDGFYSIDPDHVSQLLQTIRQQRTSVVLDRVVPEAGLKPHSIIIAPLAATEPPFRLVELFTFEVPTAERAAHLKEVAETVANYVGRCVREQEGAQIVHVTEDFWKQFDIFMLKLQQSLHMKQTVAVAVNDGRTLIGCDRVSIALRHGKRTKMYGISGQEGVQHRANLVRAMAHLADAVIRLGSPVTYRGTIEDLPPPLEQPLAEYLAESRTRMVKLIPLREPDPSMKDDDELEDRRFQKSRRLMGCLIVEQATETRPKQSVVERTDLLVSHIETAIANCEKYETIFMLPLWRGIGRGVRWFKGRRRWGAAAVMAALVAIVLALAYVPWDYRVEGTGQAMPAIQHEVFAPWDGDVMEVLVEGGQFVRQGDVLVRMESDDLETQRISLLNELQEKEKLVLSLAQQVNMAERRNEPQEAIKVQSELAKARVEAIGAQQQLDKVNSRLEKLAVKSPADGVVATFQVKQMLTDRPVRRGEVLLEVMQPEGPWRLELEVPEYRMGHVMRALSASKEGTLPVEYVPATSVEASYQGVMTRIATRSNHSEDAGTIFEVYADIDKEDLPTQNIGAEVTAKINCGPKSLAYVLFGDVYEFVMRYLWF